MRGLVWVAAAACSACIPTHRSLTMERGRIFSAPGTSQIFTSTFPVEHRKGKVLAPSKSDMVMEDDESSTPTRSILYKLDLTTRRETRLGQLRTDDWTPLYWDASEGVLWVRDGNREIVALGNSSRPLHGWHDIGLDGLPSPLVMTSTDVEQVLWNLASGQNTKLLSGRADLSVVGDMIRFTTLTPTTENAIEVRQVSIDTSGGMFRTLHDFVWTTSPLPPAVGARDAYAMLGDGRHYAELVHDGTGSRLLVYDLTTTTMSTIAVAPLPAGAVTLLAGHDDSVVLGVPDDHGCVRGYALRASASRIEPIPADLCVTGVAWSGSHRVFKTDRATAILDANAQLFELASVSPEELATAVVTGPATRALIVDAGAQLLELNLDTGETKRHALAGVANKDVLLTIDGGIARIAKGTDQIVSIALDQKTAPDRITLDTPALERADRMPLDRNEFWLGGAAGVATNGIPSVRMSAEIAHWVNDRWTMVFRGNAHFDTEDSDKRKWFDAGGSFGYAWHRLPRLWSLSLEGDVGASYAAETIGTSTRHHFAPSAEIHIGGQGKMAGLGLAVLVPSLIDLDRGIQFLLTFKIGFTENLK